MRRVLGSKAAIFARLTADQPRYGSIVREPQRARVLVTGGAGFVGRAVLGALEARGFASVVAPPSWQYDLTQPEAVDKMFADAQPDVVVHLAARVGGIGANRAHPAELYLANLLMGTYVIEAARRLQTSKLVLLGTICSYPKLAAVPFRESSLWDGYPEETNAPYGIAKKALLVHAQANRAEYGQHIIYLMSTNLYGPGDKFHPDVSHVIPALIKKFVEAKESGLPEVEVWGTGSASREFLFVDDAARGIVAALESYEGADPVNLGSGEELPIRDLVAKISEIVGYDGGIRWDASKPDGQPRRNLDVSRARDLFGFEATTPLDDGLRRTVEWYLSNRNEAEARGA